MSSSVTVIRDERGDVQAFAGRSRIWFAPSVAVLEEDHPRRRFVAALALAAGLMQTDPAPEPYDPARAAFYARYILIPDRAFSALRARATDAELAECFNVPLDQIRAKETDLAMLDVEAA